MLKHSKHLLGLVAILSMLLALGCSQSFEQFAQHAT